MEVFQVPVRRRPPTVHVYGRRRARKAGRSNEDGGAAQEGSTDSKELTDDRGACSVEIDPPLCPTSPKRTRRKAKSNATEKGDLSSSPVSSAGPTTPSTPQKASQKPEAGPRTPTTSASTSQRVKIDLGSDVARLFSSSPSKSGGASGIRSHRASPRTPTRHALKLHSEDEDDITPSSSLTASPHKAEYSTFAARMAPRQSTGAKRRIETERRSTTPVAIDGAMSSRALLHATTNLQDEVPRADDTLRPVLPSRGTSRPGKRRKDDEVERGAQRQPSAKGSASLQDLQAQWQDLDDSDSSDMEKPRLKSAASLRSSGELYQFELDLTSLLADLDVDNAVTSQRSASRQLAMQAQAVQDRSDNGESSGSDSFTSNLLASGKTDDLLARIHAICALEHQDQSMLGDFSAICASLLRHRPMAIILAKKKNFLEILACIICKGRLTRAENSSRVTIETETSPMDESPDAVAAEVLFSLLACQMRLDKDPNEIMRLSCAAVTSIGESLNDVVSNLQAARAEGMVRSTHSEIDEKLATTLLACVSLCAETFKNVPGVLDHCVELLRDERSGPIRVLSEGSVHLAHAALQCLVAMSTSEDSAVLDILSNRDCLEALIECTLRIINTIDSTQTGDDTIISIDSSTLALGLLTRLAETYPQSMCGLLVTCEVSNCLDRGENVRKVPQAAALTQMASAMLQLQGKNASNAVDISACFAVFLATILIEASKAEACNSLQEPLALKQIAQGLAARDRPEAFDKLMNVFVDANGQSPSAAGAAIFGDLWRQLDELKGSSDPKSDLSL